MNQKEKFKNSEKNVGADFHIRPPYEGMLKLKTNKGITIIALIITIILMLILAGVGTFSGLDTVKHSRVVKFVSYMQIIQKKVDEVVADNNYSTLGESAVGKSNVETILTAASANGEIKNTEVSQYRYFDKSTLSSQLGLDNIDDEIIINFETREVVSLNGIEYNSKIYYTQYLLPTGQHLINNSTEQRDLEELVVETKMNGLSAEITISNINITNGTLSYQEQDTNSWKIINNYTKAGQAEKIVLYKSGTYEFKLIDNNYNSTESIKRDFHIELANPPILEDGLTYKEDDGEIYDYTKTNFNYDNANFSNNISQPPKPAVATDGTQEYVWIPRFAYQKDSYDVVTSRFVIKLSTISTYNEGLGEDWIVPNEFEEKTGIWWLKSELEELTTINITYDKNCTEEVNNLPPKTAVEPGIRTLSTLSPERENYLFKGWNTNKDGSGTTYQSGDEITITGDITLYAMWEKEYITITYDKNCTDEVTNMPSQATVESGKEITLSTKVPGRENYLFKGWNTQADGTGTSYQSGDNINVTNDTTLYAMWYQKTIILRIPATNNYLKSNIRSLQLSFIEKSDNVEFTDDAVKEGNEDTWNREGDRGKSYLYNNYIKNRIEGKESRIITDQIQNEIVDYNVVLNNFEEIEYVVLTVYYIDETLSFSSYNYYTNSKYLNGFNLLDGNVEFSRECNIYMKETSEFKLYTGTTTTEEGTVVDWYQECPPMTLIRIVYRIND